MMYQGFDGFGCCGGGGDMGYGYGVPMYPGGGGFGMRGSFALIVVLFILLIIIGASWIN